MDLRRKRQQKRLTKFSDQKLVLLSRFRIPHFTHHSANISTLLDSTFYFPHSTIPHFTGVNCNSTAFFSAMQFSRVALKQWLLQNDGTRWCYYASPFQQHGAHVTCNLTTKTCPTYTTDLVLLHPVLSFGNWMELDETVMQRRA